MYYEIIEINKDILKIVDFLDNNINLLEILNTLKEQVEINRIKINYLKYFANKQGYEKLIRSINLTLVTFTRNSVYLDSERNRGYFSKIKEYLNKMTRLIKIRMRDNDYTIKGNKDLISDLMNYNCNIKDFFVKITKLR